MTTSKPPPGADPSAGLSADEKRALLRRLLREREEGMKAVSQPAARPPLPTLRPDLAHRYDPFALTDIQHAYWIGRGDALELGGVGAHIYSEFELPIHDAGRMSRAWSRVIARHDLLRMVVLPGGQAQVLAQVPDYQIAASDLRGLPDAEREATLQASRQEMRARRYDPAQWPMFAARMFRLEEGLSRVCISFDMLILDLRSFQIVLEEWFRFYADPDLELPALPISFRDYRMAEAALQDSEEAKAAQAYWLARLDSPQGLPPAPPLPLRRRPHDPRTFTRRRHLLPAARWQRLKSLASERGLTPAAALLAAYAQVLATWSGERRLTLNLTVFNRLPLHPAVPALVGDFTGTVLLEVDLTPQESFSARAQRLQRQLFSDLEHRAFSGVRVQRELARRSGSLSALRPHVFTSHLAGGLTSGDSFAAALPVEVIDGLSQTPQVALDHQVYEQGGALVMQWDARDGLYPPGMLDEMFAANVALLEALSGDPRPWDAVQHALAPPPQQPEVPFRSPHDPATSSATLHGLFEARARQQPDAAALKAGGITLSYRELERRSAALAARLQVKAGEPVAVVLERGWQGVAAVLAVLRAGGAYLPIDPDVPQERLRVLLETSGAGTVLTHPRAEHPRLYDALAGLLPGSAHLIEVSDSEDSVPAPTLTRPVQPSDLAYIIYTSGSTGLPKGVMIDHRGAVNTMLDISARYGVGPGDAVLGVSALTFDLSVYDVFGTLAAGGTLVLPTHAERRDPRHWLALIREHAVTVWNSVPALLGLLLEAVPDLAALASLRLILLSGDWLPLPLVARVLDELPGAQLVSLGGATEASIWSVLHEVTALDPAWSSVPYGRAMAHQSLQVLDAFLNPAPAHVPGELYIGGVGLALGYWRDAERSAERFFHHPRTGERLYRTGDLARRWPDGSFELLGRVDRQVKLHGHRIELGEIEAALRGLPEVHDALVTLRPDARGRPALSAYLVPAAELAQPEAMPAADLAELIESADILRPFQSGDPALDAELALLETLEERAAFKQQLHVPALPASGAAVPLLAPVGPHLERLSARRSSRRYSLAALDAELLRSWLGVLLQGPISGRRRYASAGDLYPVGAYLWVKAGRVAGLPEGLYALDAGAGQLAPIPGAGALSRRAYHPLINRPMYDEAAFALFLVAELRAIAPVYGDRSLHFATLEAGLMTGLLELQAAGSGLGLCQVGEIDEARLAPTLQLSRTQRLLHSLVGGRLEADSSEAARSAAIADLRTSARLKRLNERVAQLADDEAAALLSALKGEPA
ncbi:non-ribosomal peptide synthetase [Deinococcus sp.]|uniref:non-ribosomal peptide synthetase n=1 Tax=Deinococcus sp. TaxID=47478 RepID=UPI003CC61B04